MMNIMNELLVCPPSHRRNSKSDLVLRIIKAGAIYSQTESKSVVLRNA